VIESREKHVQDVRAYYDQDMLEPDIISLHGGSAAMLTRRCPGKEGPNEDALAVLPFSADASLLVVADGVGGLGNGDQAARIGIEAIQQALFAAQGSDQQLRTAVLDGIDAANRKILDRGVRSAATLALVELGLDRYPPLSCRRFDDLDSGRPRQGEAPNGVAFSRGIWPGIGIIERTGSDVPRGPASRVEHDRLPGMRIEIGPWRHLAARDTLLIASDGLVDNLHVEEIFERIRRGSLPEVARRLADDAQRRMREGESPHPSKPDDLTLILFRIDASSHASSHATSLAP
jgi:PPM family protein phosphatase